MLEHFFKQPKHTKVYLFTTEILLQFQFTRLDVVQIQKSFGILLYSQEYYQGSKRNIWRINLEVRAKFKHSVLICKSYKGGKLECSFQSNRSIILLSSQESYLRVHYVNLLLGSTRLGVPNTKLRRINYRKVMKYYSEF